MNLSLSSLVLSCLVLSCLVLSCLVLSCLVLSCLVLSCLVSSRLVLVLSCLVSSRLVLSCLVFFLCLSLSLSVSVSLSASVWCCGRVMLCCVVLCGVVWGGVCAVWCVVCDTLKYNVCPSNTSPGVRPKRPRSQTCARGAGMHGTI